MYYDKSEVDSGSRCGYSDTIPESFDAEVLGVFLQMRNANRCASDKVAELRDGSSYFEDSGDPLYGDNEGAWSWEGTKSDDVGRSITDRVYVSQHPIEDPSPTDAGDMTFEAAEPFLAAMKQGELVAAIGRAWDQCPALRSELDTVTADVWSRAPDQSKMLEHNWEEDPKPEYGDRGTVCFKNTAEDGAVNIGNLWHGMPMLGINELLDSGALVWEDEYPDESRCEECDAPGSTCTVTLEVNRKGTLRLVAETQIMCYCNSDSAEVACTDRATFRIAAPARKTKRKAK